ncbi:MAG: oligosaccharide flippase family protein [bacterium]|nr:oligosaccharide flippase family protein [bacterium]
MLKSFSWVVVATLSRQVAFLVVNALLFERLSRSMFGAVSLAFGYMLVFVGLGDFGIRQIGWREIARHPEQARALTGPLVGAKIRTITISIALWVLLMPLLWEAGAPQAIYLLFGLGIAFNASTFDFPLYGLHRIDLVAKYSLIAFAAYLLGCAVLVTSDDRSWLVPALFVAAMCLLFLLQVRWFRTNLGTLSPRLGRADFFRILRDSWPLGMGETLNRLAANYPLILLGLAVGREGVGNYRIAELLYSFLAQFGHLFASAGFSHVSHTFKHERSRLRSVLVKMIGLLLGAALIAGLLFFALGPRALTVVFDETAGETLSVIRVLGIALIFAAPTRFLKVLLAGIDRQGALLLANAITVAVGAAVGWLAIGRYGIVGMAIGLLAAELVTLFVLAFVYWQSLGARSTQAAEPVS